jgi:hypothetical protein
MHARSVAKEGLIYTAQACETYGIKDLHLSEYQ